LGKGYKRDGERRGKGKAAPSDTALAVGATKEW